MARFEQDKEYNQFKDYVATSLQLIPQQKHFIKSYQEIIHPEMVDQRTGEEIAEDVIIKAGLHFEG